MDVKALVKNISFIVGVAAISFVGLFFILFVDLYLKGDSVELFIGVILPLASIVLFILAESFKHNRFLFFMFKVLAYLFALGFILYAIAFMYTPRYTDTRSVLKLLKTYEDKKVFFLNTTKFNDAIDIPFDKNPPYIIMVIVAVLGFIAQVVNSIMNSIIGLD